MTFTQMRDQLVAMDPLNTSHIRAVNKAELEYWRRSSGFRMDTSDNILGFDCGGQQWVQEVTFPSGSLSKPEHKDLNFVRDVLSMVEKERIPAPCPIEQRWSARSTARMSPCYSDNPEKLHSWVGIIMYLPTDNQQQREAITKRFFDYSGKTLRHICPKYDATEHWAKIEAPEGERALRDTQERLRRRFPVEEFNQIRAELDPNNILPNQSFASLLEHQLETQ
jgi:L-galactono-1,4-lactone dehydrogenase